MNSEAIYSRADAIKKFHEALLDQFEKSAIGRAQVCGWSSNESQEARFSALLRSIKYDGGSIIDFGCGTGELYEFILRNYGQVQYTGIDCNDRMLEIARHTYSAEFIKCNFDEIDFNGAEFVVASGVFQFRDESNPTYYIKLIHDLFSKSDTAMAVNFLSSKRKDSEKINSELYLHPSQILELAISFTPLWVIDHSYHIGFGDITMAMFHVNKNLLWRRPQNMIL